MSDSEDFPDLIRRVRAGDAAASTELVQRYERAIRLAVRVRLHDPELRRLLDSMDICQSVLASFFVRAAAGQFQLDHPAQLLRLLEVMARNKLLKKVERQQTLRRGRGRFHCHFLDGEEPADPRPSPDNVVAHEELLREFRSRLSEGERRLADQRAAGRPWAEIAAGTGESANNLRMRLTRAIQRVSEELGLEE